MQKFKIGIDGKRLFSNRSGLGNYGRLLARKLDKQDNSSFDFHYYQGEKYAASDIWDYKQCSNAQFHFQKTRLDSYWRSYAIVDQLKKDNIDLYHGISNEIPFGIQNTKIKTVVTIHDLIFKARPTDYKFSDRIIYNQKSKFACKYAHCIIATSEATKKAIVQYYKVDPNKIKVVYQSVDPIFIKNDFYISGNSNSMGLKGRSYFLFVGASTKRKNLLYSAAALSKFQQSNAELIVAGYHPNIKAAIQQKYPELPIEWIKTFDVNDLSALYQNALALIYPSHEEGFGIPIMEAMFSACPVITSNKSSMIEIAKNAALLVDPDDIESIYGAMKKVLDTTQRKTLIQSGLKRAIMFSPEQFAQNICSVYEMLLENK